MKTTILEEVSLSTLLSKDYIKKLQSAGGKVYGVGGAVRDKYLNKESKDVDILVTGLPLEKIEDLLRPYGKSDMVGKSFGIIKFTPHGEKEPIDIAIPRQEIKQGEGHKGFQVTSDHNLPIEKDLFRRDFTLNSIAQGANGEIIDPYNGLQDIKDKIIRVTNPEAFADDPLRMLRAIQFASRFDFTIEPKTWELIIKNAHLISEISGERILEEIKKIFYKGNKELGVGLLTKSGLYQVIFESGFNRALLSKFNDTKTLSDFMYLLLPSKNKGEIYLQRLKGEMSTVEEIKALEVLSQYTEDDLQNKLLVFKAFKIAPSVIEHSGIIPPIITKEIEGMRANSLPFTFKELAVNGNDLISLGYKGKDIGDKLTYILTSIYKSDVSNNKKDIIRYLNV